MITEAMTAITMRLKRSEIAFLGNTRDAAVAGNIDRENDGQPPFDTRLDLKYRVPNVISA